MKKVYIFILFFFGLIFNANADYKVVTIGCNTAGCTSTSNIDFGGTINGNLFYDVYVRGDNSASTEYEDIYINNQLIISQASSDEDTDSWISVGSGNINLNGISNIELKAVSTDQVNFSPSGMTNYYEVKYYLIYDLQENSSTGTIVNFGGLAKNSSIDFNNQNLRKIIQVENGNLYMNYDEIMKIIIDFILTCFFVFLVWKSLIFIYKLIF